MKIEFNYRYYLNEHDYEQHHIQMNELVAKNIATNINEVGRVIQFAEAQQQQGNYVALYLSYEASKYFNPSMATHFQELDNIIAAAYSFGKIKKLDSNNKQNVTYESNHQFSFTETSENMIANIKRVQQAIVEGETYQVNYTTRLIDEIYYPITTLYNQLTQFGNGNYTVLLDTDEVQVASISPELFFQKGNFQGTENIIISKPMKGTMPRGNSDAEDQFNYETLKLSAKDRAENVMIVDLLRNDIGRISRSGTINVYKPFFIETYNTVFQMTTMVGGTLLPNTDLLKILTALFPCGSITGAPKLNTMKYIKQLESSPRGIYCGAIGLLLPNDDQKMIFNIPIRTIEYINGQAVYGVGAGITIDSNPLDEVKEFYAKTKILEML
ncbi:anthranilate synthase component I family protein [Staphylococcus sp. SS87]|nr:anthranilate synthase component I family protein [Staphylococcus singaporensis]